MLSIDTSNLFPLFFGLRGHVWEKPHTIAQRPQQTCINKNITQILTQISTSFHNNELTPIGFVPKSILEPSEHVIGRICSSSSAPSSCTTVQLDFIFCSQAAIPKSAFTSLLLTYVFTYYVLTFTYLLTFYLFFHLLTYPFFIFLNLFTYLLTQSLFFFGFIYFLV